MQSNQYSKREVEKALRRGAKAVLMSRGMNPSTRRGNRELDMLLDRLNQKSYASLEDAIRMGEAVGWEIVKLSERRNQTHLDASVIRQVADSKDLFALVMPQAEADHDQANAVDSEISVELGMARGASPIEKTPEVTVTGQASGGSKQSGAGQAGAGQSAQAKETTVTSEPVNPAEQEDDFAATAADIEGDAPMPGSVTEAIAAVTPGTTPDGADMDSDAPEEPAAVDADAVEDVLPDPSAPVGPKGASDDVTMSVASKGTEGTEDLEAAAATGDTQQDFPVESVSVPSKVSGEEQEIKEARK